MKAMPSPPEAILTIGHGGRSLDDVLEQLRRNGVEYVVDVRSVPFSRRQPEFSRPSLEAALPRVGVRYLFMGRELGGRPDDRACYVGGKVDYDRLRASPTFREGVERLRKARTQGHRVCLLCSEARPEACHRTKAIGQSLAGLGVPVLHVEPDGSLEPQEEVIRRVTDGQIGLFGDGLTSRKAYRDAAT